MRKIKFANDEFYHIYNRGVDHRPVVLNKKDSERFLISLIHFNSVEPIGGISSYMKIKDKPKNNKLVKIIAYCLNPNHFHLMLEQVKENGISIFLKSLAGGYTKYFNLTHKRSGVLFQGPFKAKLIEDNDYLLHLSSYVNLNNRVHKISEQASVLVRSSWQEYCEGGAGFCEKDIILEQFKTRDEYKEFSADLLPTMIGKRAGYKELEHLMFD